MKDLWILFGSQTGNAESVAHDVFRAAQGFDIDAACVGMERVGVGDLALACDVLLIVSTTGEGDMPDNALDLWRAVQGDDAPDLSGLNYAVLALGDSLYDEFCRAGKDWDARLAALGAKRLQPRVDCDVEFAENAQAWTQNVLQTLASQRGWNVRQVVPPPVVHVEPGYSRDAPLTATLTARRTLTGTQALREVLHCELDVGVNVQWQAGALLYVFPENDEALVAQVIDALGARPADQVYWQGRRERLDVLLRQHVELRMPSAELCAALAWEAREGEDVLDALRARPVLDAQDALEYMKPLAPRAYSVANATSGGSRDVHLTLTRIAYTHNGREYHGAATRFLAHLPIGGQLRCHFAANRYFAVPADAACDLIMIAAGSGIAPFRAFLQIRAQQNASGRNWLMFGNRNRAQDFLYGHELAAWQTQGVLRLDTAFSRDQAQKMYVQNLIHENGAEIFAWLQRGAHIRLCGSAYPMAADVEAALLEVVAKHGNMRAANAEGYMAILKNDKRFVRDVY